jgi:hypothetical protein
MTKNTQNIGETIRRFTGGAVNVKDRILEDGRIYGNIARGAEQR